MAAAGGDIRAGGAYVEAYTVNNVGPGLTAVQGDVKAAAATVKAQLAEQAAAAAKQAETMRRGADVTRAVRTASEVYADKLKELNGLLSAGAISQQTHSRAVAQVGAEFKRAGESAEGGVHGFKKWAKELDEPVKAAAAVVGALTVAGEAIFTFAGGHVAIEKLNDQLEKTVTLTEKLVAAKQKGIDRKTAEAEVGTQAEQLTKFQALAAAAKDDLAALSAALTKAKATHEELKDDTFLGIHGKDLPLAGRGKQAEIDAAKQKAEDLQKVYDQTKDAATEYQKRIAELADPAKNLELVKGIDEATKALRVQADTFGKTEAEIARYELTAKGASDAMLKQFDVEQKRLYDLQQQKNAKEFEEAQFAEYQDQLTAEGDAKRKAFEARSNLATDLSTAIIDGYDALKGSFKQSFGQGNLAGSLDFAAGDNSKNVIEEAQKQTHLAEKSVDIQQKMLDEIKEIRKNGPDAFN